jgi:hypothetical protein
MIEDDVNKGTGTFPGDRKAADATWSEPYFPPIASTE